MAAERGNMFSKDDHLTPSSRKSDGLAFSRYSAYMLDEVEKLIDDPGDALDAFHAYGKLQRGLDYEANVSPVEAAISVLGITEKPMATLVRS